MELINALAFVAPGFASRWLERRARYHTAKRYYEAAQFDSYRPTRGGQHSGNMNMEKAGTKLRGLARYLEENHDLAVGIIDDLVNNVIGPGVAVEPQARKRPQGDEPGELHEAFNNSVREAWEEWTEYPETTGELGFESVERLMARHVFRDGEIFVQFIGNQTYPYKTRIPFVLELIEPDLVPMDLNDESQRIVHGVKRNGWGMPTSYFVLKDHPSSKLYYPVIGVGDTRQVSAQRIKHLKFSRRLQQVRGVSLLHASMNRIRDLADYEESERIAARVAASVALAINRTNEYQGSAVDNSKRELEMQAGAIYELLPGESMSTVGSDRPNTGLADFRKAMMRAIVAGTGSRYSSVARDYSGTYSSQRQELVEGSVGYRSLFGYFRNKAYRPMYTRWMEQALFSGAIRAPRDLDMTTIFRADFRPPALPWIDPQKEAKAWETLIQNNLESHSEIARQRGRDPQRIREEIEQEQASGLYDGINATSVEENEQQELDDEENRVIELGGFRA